LPHACTALADGLMLVFRDTSGDEGSGFGKKQLPEPDHRRLPSPVREDGENYGASSRRLPEP